MDGIGHGLRLLRQDTMGGSGGEKAEEEMAEKLFQTARQSFGRGTAVPFRVSPYMALENCFTVLCSSACISV